MVRRKKIVIGFIVTVFLVVFSVWIASALVEKREAREAEKSDFDYDTYNGGVEYFGKK